MNFQQIQVNETEENILYGISKWHNETPSLWIPNYQASEADIQETIKRMRDNDCYVGIAKDEAIKAFIWAEKQDEAVMILSLYVDESVRQQNVGTSLKEALEAWCVENGIKKIKTTVHSKNKKMLALNEKLGYEAKMVHMEKIID